MQLQPEATLATLLGSLFPSAEIGVGIVAYHEQGDPTDSYCTYERTASELEKDLQGIIHKNTVDLQIHCSAKFAQQAFESAITTLDQTRSNGWYFDWQGQQLTQQEFENGENVFTMSYFFQAIQVS